MGFSDIIYFLSFRQYIGNSASQKGWEEPRNPALTLRASFFSSFLIVLSKNFQIKEEETLQSVNI